MRGVRKQETTKKMHVIHLVIIFLCCLSSVFYNGGTFHAQQAVAKETPWSKIRVMPGGESVGLKLQTKGVLIIGFHSFTSKNGPVSPGKTAGLKVGDIITKINQKTVNSLSEIKDEVDHSGKEGKPISLNLERSQHVLTMSIWPQQDAQDHTYQLGIFIRNQASGIGTLTFYEPGSGTYGALGHVISNQESDGPMSVKAGQLLKSSVMAIQRGTSGKPGEKIASFASENHPIGTILKNSPFGVFGHLNTSLNNGIMDQALPIALSDQVKTGPAKMLTVLNGQKVEAFNIQIVQSIPQSMPATKGLVIKVTDPRLLRATGGIVQGMSGSPIIQDGKLIGAVTHVFVNDPTSGYGVHIEWMLKEAGIQFSSHHNNLQKVG